MPKFYSLEKPPLEKVEKLERKLGEYPEIKPRLAFLFPVNKSRETALEMIKSEKEINQEEVLELLESEDFVEKEAGLYLLNKTPKLSEEISEKALPILEKMIQSKDKYIREEAIKGLGQIGEKTLPVLEKMIQDKNMYVREAATKGLGQIGEKALPILGRISQDENELWVVRETAAKVIIKIIIETQGEEKALPILEINSWNKSWHIREAVIYGLGQIDKEKALPILKRMSQQDGYTNIREAATKELNKSNKTEFNSWLLATKKSLFATPETKQLSEKIVKLEEITKKLKEKFKDDFIGIVIFGSTAKGYSKKGSDIDWGIIAKNPKVFKYFKELAANKYHLNLCIIEHYVNVNKNYQAVSHQEVPFYGLFFGDHKQLQKIQKTILENIDETKWDDIRREIKESETNLSKAAHRYNLTDDEIGKVKQFVSLLRVPPSYAEALKLVQSRSKE